MSIKLTDTQLVMLSAAAQRDDRCLVASQNLKGVRAQKVAAKLIAAGLVKEIRAKAGTPVWRRDEQAGQSYGLRLTARGAKAIAIDESSASDEARQDGGQREQVATTTDSRIVRHATADVSAADAAPSLSAPRGGTKLAQVVELLQHHHGATREELVAATGWLPHTTRAALTGLRKRGCAVTIDRSDKERGSTYRAWLDGTIAAGEAAAQSDSPLGTPATPKSKRAQRAEKSQARQAA
jgi:uncharacterized protein DUF3489